MPKLHRRPARRTRLSSRRADDARLDAAQRVEFSSQHAGHVHYHLYRRRRLSLLARCRLRASGFLARGRARDDLPMKVDFAHAGDAYTDYDDAPLLDAAGCGGAHLGGVFSISSSSPSRHGRAVSSSSRAMQLALALEGYYCCDFVTT